MNDSNVYILAVRINGDEYLANFPLGNKNYPVFYPTLEEAKDLFSMAYKILAAGPLQNTTLFAAQFEKMAVFQPVYIKLPRMQSVDILTEAVIDQILVTFDISLLPQPLAYCKMKKGFIEKYLALDILKDIESIQSVGPDGNIIINQFTVQDLRDGKTPPINVKEIDPDEILRKRGLL